MAEYITRICFTVYGFGVGEGEEDEMKEVIRAMYRLRLPEAKELSVSLSQKTLSKEQVRTKPQKEE